MICTPKELEPRIAETERNLADLCHYAATHGILGVTDFRRDYLQLFIDLRETLSERDALAASLRSIANSSCCSGCREAALVAQAALRKVGGR